MKIQIITAWEAQRCAGLSVASHAHGYYEAVFYPEGGGCGRIGESDYEFFPGCFAVIPQGVFHSERHAENGRVICIGFSGSGISSAAGVFRDADGELVSLARRTVREIAEQRPGYDRLSGLIAEEMLILIGRLTGGGQSGERDLGYAAEFIRGNCHEKLSLPSVAAQLNISYEYFRHCFAARYGVSPAKYLLSARISAAEKLLSGSDESCTGIAERCGFSDSSQFAMLFRRETGMSPTGYRKKHRE